MSIHKLSVIDEKLWFESALNSQSCNNIGTDPQCFKYYNGVFNKTQGIGRKENNPLPSKEDNWIIRDNMGRVKNFIRNINYLTKHSLWDQREEDIVYLSNKIIDDAGYEYQLIGNTINILGLDESLCVLRENPKSFVRLNDGEFKLLSGMDQPFQKYEEGIASRFRKMLSEPNDSLYVGVPEVYFNNFSSGYLRRYAYDFRKIIYSYYNPNMTFIDGGIASARIQYLSKEEAHPYVEWWKSFFQGRKLVIVCGYHILDKLKYDIFEMASSKRFVFGPKRHAWDEYSYLMNEITSTVNKKDEVVVFILGMAGKAMIYDLTELGYTCWDIGHLAKLYNAYMSDMVWDEKNTREFFKPD